MNGVQIQSLGEIVQTLEESGAEVRDVDIEFEETQGVTAALSRIATGQTPKKPIANIEVKVNGVSVVPDDYLKRQYGETDEE